MNIENITSKGISLNINGQSMQREIYEREIVKLQSNWNSLREFIGKEWYCFDNESVEFEVAKNILDKMNELEGNDNNGIMDKKSR